MTQFYMFVWLFLIMIWSNNCHRNVYAYNFCMQVLMAYYSYLVKCLPMDDTVFTATLTKHKLLPGNIKSQLTALRTQADRALYFLDHVIKPALDIDDTSSFNKLLSIMEQCGYDHVEKLACKIKSGIGKASDTKPGSYVYDT